VTLTKHLGHRGLILLVVGFLWVLRGYSIATGAEVNPAGAQGLFHLMMPDELRAWLWLGSGLLAIAAATWDTPRWQAVGFGVLIVLPAERCLSYLGGWLVHLLSRWWPELDGYPDGWATAIGWAAVVVVIGICAHWPEAEPEPEPAPMGVSP
jgi:hypothetical protein